MLLMTAAERPVTGSTELSILFPLPFASRGRVHHLSWMLAASSGIIDVLRLSATIADSRSRSKPASGDRTGCGCCSVNALSRPLGSRSKDNPHMDEVIEAPQRQLDLAFAWRNRFARLGQAFHTELAPTPLPSPYMVGLNLALAGELGLSSQILASQ